MYGRDRRANNGPRPPAPPVAWQFDAKGWTLLGTQKVNGRRDKDTIRVGRYAG